MSWVLLAILAAIFATLVAVFGKIGLASIDPTLGSTVRVVVMAIFLIVVSVSLGKLKLLSSIDSRGAWFILFSGVAGALSWLCYFTAIKMGPVSAVSALDRLSLVFTVVIAALFLGEALTIKTGIATVLITIGTLLFVF